MLESDQNQIINRDVTRADLPPGVFVRVHRGPGLLLETSVKRLSEEEVTLKNYLYEPLNGSGDVLRKL